MLKKLLSITLALALMLGIFCIPVSALEATPTASTVLVNGENVAFDAYKINDNNYFKLRDLAYILNGTAKQFNVGWDGANNAISLTSGQPYTAVGGEMTGKGSGAKTPELTNSKILKDGAEVSFTAYNIEGNNYFKLRDIGAAFNFGVDWDGARNTIAIDTSKGYTPDGAAMPPATSNASWTGTWESTSGFLGTMTLTQNGNTVTGTGTGINGTISGTVSGNALTVTATDKDGDSAKYRFTMSADGNKFTIEDWDSFFETWSDFATATRITPKTPSGGNTSLTNMWWRAGLISGGFIYLHFDSNGGFMQEVRMNTAGPISFITLWEEVYKGSYTVSGNTFTLTYTSAEHKKSGEQWGSIALPANRTLTYTFGEDEYNGKYIDVTNGGLPPFNEPVTRLSNQTSSEACVLTRFFETSNDSSALGR